MLQSLLPAGVSGAETRGDEFESAAFDLEFPFVLASSAKRRRDFAAGRTCARRALARFGIEAGPLPIALNRTVAWPAGFIGSITHTEGYCAAAVARLADYSSLGIDAEGIGNVDERLEEAICVPSERERLRRAGSAERRLLSTLIFSAKEAFYKWQYPLTGKWLDFHEVEIESDRDTFVAQALVSLGHSIGFARVPGRFAADDSVVVSVCAR